MIGLTKRDLLKEVLVIFGALQLALGLIHARTFFSLGTVRSKTLTRLALDWQDVLKRASVDD